MTGVQTCALPICPEEHNNYFVDIYQFILPFTASDVHIQEDEVETFEISTIDNVRKIGENDDFLHYKRLKNLL